MLSPSIARLSSKQVALLLSASGVLLRLFAVPGSVGDVDSVNHARALAEFDPLHQAPHFPGYPIYTAVTQLFARCGLPESWALSLPGVLLFAVAGPLLYRSLAARTSARVALGTLAVSALAPTAVVASAWPSSDGFGFSWLLLSAALVLWPGGRLAPLAAGCLGLGLGIRLSYAPALLSLFVLLLVQSQKLHKIQLFAYAGVGVCLWACPMVMVVGPEPLWTLAKGFVSGHFSDFGNTAFSEPSQGERLARYAWSVWDAGLGAAYPFAIPGLHARGEGGLAAYAVAALVLVALAAGVRFQRLEASHRQWMWITVALGAPYVLWLLLAQNPDKPRHLLPLLPLIGVLLSLSTQVLRRGELILSLLFASMALVTLPRALAQGAQPVPALAMAEQLESVLRAKPHAPILVLAGAESRVLQHRLPSLRVLRPQDFDIAINEAQRARRLGVDVLITSNVVGITKHVTWPVVLDARFDASVRPQDARMVLYRIADIEHTHPPAVIAALAKQGTP